MMELESQDCYDKSISDSFSKASIRLGFIRKVYLILSTQLLFTVIFCIFSLSSKEFQRFQIENPWMIGIALIFYIGTTIILFCFKALCRVVPTNYILLGLFTLSLSYIVSNVCSSVGDPYTVLAAAILTVGVTFALTIYAMTTKDDFTMIGGFMFIFFITLFLTGILMWTLSALSNIFYILYCAIGVLFYGVYLIYDTQLIVGGQHHVLEIDDYILGSIILYVDIISLFLRILEILMKLKGK